MIDWVWCSSAALGVIIGTGVADCISSIRKYFSNKKFMKEIEEMHKSSEKIREESWKLLDHQKKEIDEAFEKLEERHREVEKLKNVLPTLVELNYLVEQTVKELKNGTKECNG